MYEFTMGLAGVSQWLPDHGDDPLVRLELLMKMTGNMVKEETLSRLNDLLDQVIRWGMKVLLGVVVGFHVVQGLLLPYADSLKNGAAQKLVGMIPGIGQGSRCSSTDDLRVRCPVKKCCWHGGSCGSVPDPGGSHVKASGADAVLPVRCRNPGADLR